MKRNLAAFALGATVLAAAVPPMACAQAPNSTVMKTNTVTTGATFRNPLKKEGADPWLSFYNGYYYLTSTTGGDIKMRRARRIGELAAAEDVQVWKDATPNRFRDMWATEFFRFDSGNGMRWYGYYTAADGKADGNHRMFVLESAGDDPMGPYHFKAQIQTDPKNETYAIDGTVAKLPDGRMYFIWCGRPSPAGQGLYISLMSNPWTTTGERTYLPVDGLGSDVVREGPNVLVRNGRVFLVYSVCGASTPDYKLGMVSIPDSADLLKWENWKQFPTTVFARVDQWGVYGPGHNTFFKSPDGTQDWITYHAKTTMKDTYADRTTRAQPFTWNADGTPNFGLPLSTDTDIPVPSGEK